MPRKKRFNFPLSFPAKIRIFRTNQYKKEKNVSEFDVTPKSWMV